MPWVKRDESIRSNYERLLDIKLNPEEEIDEEKYTHRLSYEKRNNLLLFTLEFFCSP